jgi:murein DD-endopeptidase MepM/ murein hydrolase activator NlpD
LLRRALIGLSLAATLLLAGSPGTSAPPQGSGAAARAFAVRVVVPGQPGAATTTVSAPPDAVEFGGPFSYPEDGTVLTTGSFTASAAAGAGGTAYATASSEVTSISVFGGEVTAQAVTSRAKATAKPGEASGDLGGAGVSGLVVLGQPVEPTPNGRVALADWGYLVVLQQAVAPSERAYRGFVTALTIHLTADHGGVPAGSDIQIGYAEATVQAAAPPPPVQTPKPIARPPAGGKHPLKPPEPNQTPGLPPPVERRRPPDIDVAFTVRGYVFPVYGPASFSNDYGAPRAGVVWHHGNDIFADLGAPILAVSKGTVFSVGWNDLGGNRLWLRDAKGNQFYYAHLSAYTPLAVNSAHVNAGDVLGFVGNTGDAEGTPYHLHFEIHPAALLGLGYDGVINPFPYLSAWKRLEDLRFAAAAGWAPSPALRSNAPKPGAILLQASDISGENGLAPGSLGRVFSPAATEGDGALLGFRGPPTVLAAGAR